MKRYINLDLHISFLLSLLLLTAAPAHAVDLGSQNFQSVLVNEALTEKALVREPSPDNKKIEKIYVSSNDVIQQSDPYPSLLNVFHKTTNEEIIRQELLFNEGDVWNQAKIDETARNLRNNLSINVAQVIACKGSAPDQVVVLVLTKDLWSLRANTSFTYADSKLENTSIILTETNLFGMNKQPSLLYSADLASQSFGESYTDPRVGGSRLSVTESASVITNKASGQNEGGTFLIDVEKPLYSLDTPWAYGVTVSGTKDIYRLFEGGQLAGYQSPTTGEVIPYMYNQQDWEAMAKVTRSFGTSQKNDLMFGWRAWIREYSVPDSGTSAQAQTLQDFQNNILPDSERAGMLFFNYHYYTAHYVKLTNMESFAVTEDYQLGPNFTTEVRLANPVFGFSSQFFEAVGTYNYTWYGHDDLLVTGLAAKARYEPDNYLTEGWVNDYVTYSLHNTSPQFGIFRLVLGFNYTDRGPDLNHTMEDLGGSQDLRGYPTNYFVGSQMFVGNLELRTKPVAISTMHIGTVAFIDGGDAVNNWSDFQMNYSVGAGLRVVFPEFNKSVLRFDMAMPLEKINGSQSPAAVVTFGQAF
jgi:outer membrane protein assembly factor BamA